MPHYDYICLECRRRSRLFFTFADYDSAEPCCPHCDSRRLKRRIGRVALGKSEDARLDALADDSALANLDEDDPRALGQLMRQMSHEMGEDMGAEFDEVVDRLEKGQSPDEIEQAMPDLAAGAGDDPL